MHQCLFCGEVCYCDSCGDVGCPHFWCGMDFRGWVTAEETVNKINTNRNRIDNYDVLEYIDSED